MKSQKDDQKEEGGVGKSVCLVQKGGVFMYFPLDFLSSANYSKKIASNKAFILLTATTKVPEVCPKSNS